MNSLEEISLKVRAFDVDANNRIKVSTIFDYFQDAASLHADNLKIGYDDLIPKGLFWVLSWARFEFEHYPKFKDEIKIQTWGKKQFKLYSLRDFLLFNSDEQIVCKGTTAWLLLDAKTMRPKIMPLLFPQMIFLEEKSAVDDLPQKFPVMLLKDVLYKKNIRYSDIDLNRHANNAKYVELIQDCFDPEFHNLHQIKSLTISFLSEAKYGDTLEVSMNHETVKEKIQFIEAKNLDTNKIVFQAMTEWKLLR